MKIIVAIKPLAEGAEPKVAQVGTRMLRRADVLGELRKLKHYAVRNRDTATAEGREDDAEVQRIRIRCFDLALDAMFCLPEFTNSQAIEARKSDT